jgi:predicted enzyme related to lactoylglutathione lyase
LEFQYIEMAETKMYMFNSGGPEAPGSTGALVNDKENVPSTNGTIVYFSCEDVSNEAARVEEAGGKLLFPKMSIGDFGFISQFIDLKGNRIGLHSHK